MRRMMAIAEHHPEQLYERNKEALAMGKKKLHEFAAVSEKDLPMKARSAKLKTGGMGMRHIIGRHGKKGGR